MLRHNQICSTNHETQTGAIFLFITPSFADKIHISPFCTLKHNHFCICLAHTKLARPKSKESQHVPILLMMLPLWAQETHTIRFESVAKAFACQCYADLNVSKMLKETIQSCMTRFMFAYYAKSTLMIHTHIYTIRWKHRDPNRTC